MKIIAAAGAVLGVMMVTSVQAQLKPEWQGFWAGSCRLDPPFQGIRTFKASLDVNPIAANHYTWILTYEYSASRQEVRNYELKPTDTPNRYVLDENNGLEILTRLSGDTLYSAYHIGGRLYHSADSLRGDRLVMEIASYNDNNTHDTCLTGSPATCVKSLRPSLLQICELARDGG